MADKTGQETARRTLEEHRHLFRFIADLELHLEQGLKRQGDAGNWAAELGDFLTELEKSLNDHFAFEEGSRFWQELSLAFPRAARRIEGLVSEHHRILDAIGRLATEAREGGAKKEGCRAGLPAAVRRVLSRLHRHEAEEDELIQNLYCDDLGAGD